MRLAGVVAELEVRAAPAHRRVAPHRVVRDEQAVGVALDHRQAGEEDGVEQGRRVLADAAADALSQHAVAGDHRREVEAAVLGARPHASR